MKILFDLLYIRDSRTTGVANFAFRLLDGIKQYYGNIINDIILLIDEKDIDIINERFMNFNYIASTKFNRIKIPYISSIIESIELNKIIKNNKINIYYNPFVHANSKLCKCVMVGTIHDIQQLSLKKGIKLHVYKYFFKKKLKCYRKLICISQYSNNEITKFMPELKERCCVVYNSVLVAPMEPIQNINTLKPYILNVNTLLKYKNVLTLVKAYVLIKDIVPHNLVLKAKKTPYWNEIVKPYIDKYDLNNRVFLIEDSLTNGQMVTLYANAALFVSPSTMEGFGLTPIEAMICGVPTIVSKISALYESTMGMAIYLKDSYDVNGLADLMLNTIRNKNSKTLNKIAKKLSETYSIQRNAEGYLNEWEINYKQ